MVPTDDAHDLYGVVSDALGNIARAGARLRRRRPDGGITLATYPGIASFWVLPRLARLREQSPGTVVQVVTAELEAHIPLQSADCAILFGDGDWPGYEARLIFSESVVPVATPRLVEALSGTSPQELCKNGPLIHLDDPENRWLTWRDWRDEFASKTVELDHSVIVTNHGVAIHQALQGNGIALAWIDIVRDLVDSGVLVRLHDKSMTSRRGYYFLSPPEFSKHIAYLNIIRALGFSE